MLPLTYQLEVHASDSRILLGVVFIEIVSYGKIITLRGIFLFVTNGILLAVRGLVGTLFFYFPFQCGFGFMKMREPPP